MNPDQAIFDAIAAACRPDPVTPMAVIVNVKAFIDTFNNHRDRKLCTSIDPKPSQAEIAALARDLVKAGESETPLLPCPICGGEAIHAIDTLKRVVINPIQESDVIDLLFKAAERK